MRTHDHGFETGKGKKLSRKKNKNIKALRKHIDEMIDEHIARLMEESANHFSQPHIDETGRAIFRSMQNQLAGSQFEIQAKLEISHPLDHSERQADDLAQSVMLGNPEQSQDILSNPTNEVSRMSEGDKSGMQTSGEFDQQLQSSKGQGQKLDDGTKSELEEHTGTDLSGVNIHTSGQAHDMSEGINAKAFTHGQDIYFKQGNYNPDSKEGKELLAHEVAHTVQQGNGVQTKIQKMDNPDVIADRKKYQKDVLGTITKDLGSDYELSKLQTLFFGTIKGGVPAWRNNIIRYYLLDRGWEADKDPVPQWVEYKYVIDKESNSESLVVYTPIPDFAGREAAFGFVRWDLGFGEGKKFYRYQGNKEDFDAANDIATLKDHKTAGKNVLMGTTTKVEQVFDESYIPIKPKPAINLAYQLVSDHVTTLYIQNPSSPGSFFDHTEYTIALKDLLSETKSVHAGKLTDLRASRRDQFVRTKQGAKKTDFETLEGLEQVPKDKAQEFVEGTTLGIAKKIFIDGKNYSDSDLQEEGIGSNMLIKYFGRFKEGIGKAVFFIRSYPNCAIGKYDAEKAIESYNATIINAYLFPEEAVDFSVADALMDKAYADLYEDVYKEGGIFDQRLTFATSALPELKKNKYLKNYTDVFAYIDAAIAGKKPAPPSGGGLPAQVDLKPLANMEIALGMMDILAQVGMLGTLMLDEHISLPNAGNYFGPFMDLALGLNNLLTFNQPGYEEEIVKLIDQGHNMMAEHAYADGLRVDIEWEQIERDLKSSELTGILIAATIVTFWAGGILGQVVGSLVRTGLIEAGLSSSSLVVSIAAGSAEVITAAVSSTLIMHAVESAVTGKDFTEGLGKDLVVNTILFGVAKVVEVIMVAASGVPSTAVKIGDGVWKASLGERIVYYVDQSLTSIFGSSASISSAVKAPTALSAYPIVQSELKQVEYILSNAGLDANLIENSLRSADVTTLQYFETNPGKLVEAAEKMTTELPGLSKMGPSVKLTETVKFLDGFAKGEGRVAVQSMTNVYKATSDEISLAKKKISDYRSIAGNDAGNYGYLEGKAGAIQLDGTMVPSGPPVPKSEQIFDALEVNTQQQVGGENSWLRTTDSEYKMLNDLARRLGGQKGVVYPSITGEFKLVSERVYCPSCRGVIQQFNEMFPNLKIILIDGVK